MKGIRLNNTTPVGQVLRADYDEDAKEYTLVIKGNESEGILVVQDLAHHEIHEGNHYAYINAQDIAGSTTISFVIVVPDTPYVPHMEFFLNGESEYSLEIYEDATPDDEGTLVATPGIFNRNRNKPDNNSTKIYSGPTLGAGSKGTLLSRIHVGSGNNVGGETRGDNEIILRSNTKYWVDITNISATANYISWVVDWYERIP